MAAPVDAGDWFHRALTEAAAGEIAAAAQRYEGAGRTDPAVVVVPYQSKPVLPAPPARRRAFEARLDEIVAAAFAEPVPAADPGPERTAGEAGQGALLDAGCAACQGHCCAHGGESHAFLGPSDIQRLRRRRPGLSPAEARAAYLDLLPRTSVLGACLFQSAKGCTLPRDLRADLCNDFRCRGLKQIARLAAEGRGGIVVVAEFQGRSASVTAIGPG